MPPFPERESSILAKLKRKKGPGHLPDIDDARRNVNGNTEHTENSEDAKKVSTVSSARRTCRLSFLHVQQQRFSTFVFSHGTFYAMKKTHSKQEHY